MIDGERWRGIIGGIIRWRPARPGRDSLRSCSPRSTGANDDSGERSMAVGARPTGASAGGADRCIAVGTDAAALGMLPRGIVAAEMA